MCARVLQAARGQGCTVGDELVVEPGGAGEGPDEEAGEGCQNCSRVSGRAGAQSPLWGVSDVESGRDASGSAYRARRKERGGGRSL